MASVISHAVFAMVAAKSVKNKVSLKVYPLAIFCSVFPDIDVIGFNFGIKYGDMLGHRGFTHSIFFSFLLGFLVTLLFFRKEQTFSKKMVGLVFVFQCGECFSRYL